MGSGGHEMGNYNKSHGWVMWNMADHWWTTRDREWMGRSAPKLIESCEWVIRERKSTMREFPEGQRAIEYGWLPAGSLEDVTDYWYWMVTNACTAAMSKKLFGKRKILSNSENNRPSGEKHMRLMFCSALWSG